MAGTEATVTMMTQMLMSDDVTGVEAKMWLTSLVLIQEPTVAMLQKVQPVLKKASLQDSALLPVSTMVNNLCQRQQDCSQEPAVRNVMEALEDVIGSSCYVNNKNLEKVSCTPVFVDKEKNMNMFNQRVDIIVIKQEQLETFHFNKTEQCLKKNPCFFECLFSAGF